jgi:hypothetical protein
MSVLYVGAYAWSYSFQVSNSSSGYTSISGVSVSVSNAGCSNCTAATSSQRKSSLGANSYGGSMSVLYIGAYAWSYSVKANSSSSSGYTSISGVSVSVSNAGCFNCLAATSSQGEPFGANSYGGSMSVLYVGAYAWSFSSEEASSSSSSGYTSISGVSVSVSNAGCFNCTAATSSQANSNGANSYGGTMSVLYVGAYGYSFSGGSAGESSRSVCDFTRVIGLNISVQTSDIRLSRASSRAFPCFQHRLSSRSCFRSS